MMYAVKPHKYGGHDPKKLAKAAEYNRVAVRVAAYLNAKSATIPARERENLSSHTVARELGEDSETVRHIIMSYEGGSNGMFVYGPGSGGISARCAARLIAGTSRGHR